ncbi:MAG: hypothetical protein J6B75_07525 [Ruminococcus sp.]|nr:hypothetical protein [Ruminococcus sp.]
MLSLQEREHKKGMFAKKTSENIKKYSELYAEFCQNGYTKALAEDYADFFVENAKKPAHGDIIQTAQLFDRLHDFKSAAFYLERLEDVTKKMTHEEKFLYCIEALKNKSKLGNWRDAEDFRTENINFMQIHSDKVDMNQKADMYIALALSDCAARHYSSAFRLLTGFGYKPQGRNDVKLLEILTTGVYICAKSGDTASVENAVNNARAALGLFKEFEHSWSKSYYETRIAEAAEGIA